MSHDIEMRDGKYQFAYTGKPTWHGLGVKVEADLTAKEMVEAAGLDWQVATRSTSCKINSVTADGKVKRSSVNIPQSKALVRVFKDGSEELMKTKPVGELWNPVQNEDAFGFFQKFLDVGQMTMETAGSISNGTRVFGVAKMAHGFNVGPEKLGDRVDSYLLLLNPHRYRESFKALHTPVRVVCNNTLQLALSKAGSSMENGFSMAHSRVWDERMQEEAAEMLGLAAAQSEEYAEKANFLASKRYTTEQVQDYFADIFNVKEERVIKVRAKQDNWPRTMKLALDALEGQPGAEKSEGSWWQAFNAVTFMADHVGGRGTETRADSAIFGARATQKGKALTKALEFAK